MLLIVTSLFMMLISITSSLPIKVLSIFASIAHSCFCYNIVKFHDTENLIILISQVILAFIALDSNIDAYIMKEREEKKKIDNMVRQILLQSMESSSNIQAEESESKQSSKQDHKKHQKHKGKH